MLQLSGALEMQAQRLRRDTLKCLNATISGTVTTGLWQLLENFFGVDEDIDVAELEDAASLTHYLRLKREEKVETPSVLKEVAEEEDAAEDVFIDDTNSVSSSQVTSSKDPPKHTLTQTKAAQERKSKTYNSICSLKEAQLFYPTSKATMHQTGVDSAHIGEHSKMGGYKGYYVCAHGECDYATQTKAIVASHV